MSISMDRNKRVDDAFRVFQRNVRSVVCVCSVSVVLFCIVMSWVV